MLNKHMLVFVKKEKFKAPVHTYSLWADQVAEERGEHNENDRICDPGQILKWHVPFQLYIHPFVSFGKDGGKKASIWEKFKKNFVFKNIVGDF